MSFIFGKYLYQKKVMTFYQMAKSVYAYFCHKVFGRPLSWLHSQVFDTCFNAFPKASLLKHVEEFLDLHLEQLYYKPSYEALSHAKSQGDITAILSSSPDFLVEAIAKRLQITYWIGTCYQVDKQGRLCKIACIVDGDYKADFLKKLIARYQVPKEHVTAYSDSLLDLPMMNVAGVRFGVNPGRLFYSHCKKHDWNII